MAHMGAEEDAYTLSPKLQGLGELQESNIMSIYSVYNYGLGYLNRTSNMIWA